MKLFDFNKTTPYVKKEGIAGYFQLLYENFFDLILVNLLFVLFCVPIITIGSSYKALIMVCNKITNDEVVSIISDFIQFFKSDFVKSSFYGLLLLLTFIAIDFALVFYAIASVNIKAMGILCSICIGCHIILSGILLFFSIIYTQVSQSFSLLIRNSFVLLFLNIKTFLLVFVYIILIVFIIWALSPYSWPVILILPFSLIALANSYFVLPIVKKSFNL